MTRAKRSSNGVGSLTLENALWVTVSAFTIVILLFVSLHAADVFRLPKELLVRAEAIIVLALIGIAIVWQPGKWRSLLPDRVTARAMGACAAATLIAFAASTNRPISIRSIGYTFSLMICFWGTYLAVRERFSSRTVLIGAAAAVPNAALAIAQSLNIFNPFTFPPNLAHRMRTTAFIGNPNDVGASLAVCFIAVLALALVSRRWMSIAVAALLFAGVIASDALTAMIAIAGAIAVTVFLWSRRVGFSTLIALVLVTSATTLILPPLRGRINAMAAAARARDYDAFTAHRIVGYLTALKIFEDHPLAGAGPGTFKWLHLPYRIRVEAVHPTLYLKIVENIGEVHSDHLQVLAEEGLLGYAALLVAVVALGSRSLQRSKNNRELDERAKFVRLAALPLAVGFLLLAATGFPLELTAVMTPLLFFAACLFSWSAHDSSA